MPNIDKILAEAVAHHTAGRLEEAEGGYLAALRISPAHMAVTHNLGVIAATRGDYLLAIERFNTVISTQPSYFAAHYNRAAALAALGRRSDAIWSFKRASAIEPDHYATHRALAFLWLAEGERERALD